MRGASPWWPVRWPVRWRVTGAFGAAFVVVMGVVGAIVLAWFGHDLSAADDEALQVRVDALAAAQAASEAVLALGGSDVGFDESPTQIVDGNGRPLASSDGLRVALLTADQVRAAGTSPLLADRPGDLRLDEDLRLLAQPVTMADGRRVVVVAASSQDETRERVRSLSVIGSFGLIAALALCGAAGYLVAGVALRPVETMRLDAEAVSSAAEGRLTAPPVDDEIGRLAGTLNTMLGRLRAARDAEQSAVQRELRFVSDASHELRHPLAVLRIEIDVALAASHPAPAELRAALVSAGEETSRLCDLTDDLLTLVRTRALGSQPHRVDLAAVLRDVVDEHRDDARDAGRSITLRCDVPGGATVDPVLIRSAVGNLLSNALRHGAGAVRCEAAAADGTLTIEVSDQGPGFDADFLPRALDRFSRADTARHGPGAGLGLAVVDAVATAHRGHVHVDAEAAGARVVIVLPDPAPRSSTSTHA